MEVGVSPKVLARLIDAVAHKNQWKRGKRGADTCWKNMFGVYVNVRAKPLGQPGACTGWRLTLSTTTWRLEILATGLTHNREIDGRYTAWTNATNRATKPNSREINRLLAASKEFDAWFEENSVTFPSFMHKDNRFILDVTVVEGLDDFQTAMTKLMLFDTEWYDPW